MEKILLIIKREYLLRVRKKSFVIMTLLAPLLFMLLTIIPVLLIENGIEDKRVAVIDEAGTYGKSLSSHENLHYYLLQGKIDSVKAEVVAGDFDALLYLPTSFSVSNPSGVLFFEEALGVGAEKTIKEDLEGILRNEKLVAKGISQEMLNSLEVQVDLSSKGIEADVQSEDTEKNTGLATAIGFAGGFLIYMFIFIYGSMTLQAVVEEKSSRIIEVLVSAVSPFELMMGKVIGISLVGLTQFALWLALSSGLSAVGGTVASLFIDKQADVSSKTVIASQDMGSITTKDVQLKTQEAMEKADPLHDIKKALGTVNMPVVIGGFLFFFLGGYLLYGALFAAIGASGDSITETQQFTLPVSLPLIVGFIAGQAVVQDPGSMMAKILSIFPLTSPIVMVIRLPFGVPLWELALSMVSLVLGFMGAIWVAGRIYRIGILMYGVKPSYKKILKWITMKL